MRKNTNNMPNNKPEVYLEPRVAKLEVGLDRLTDDVRNLALVVREQGTQMEGEIQKLVVAVTQAAGPRATNWGNIIAAVGVALAVGSAIFYPLNQTTQENKIAIERYHTSMVEHQKLDMHPVGQTRIDALVKDVDITKADLVRRDSELDTKIQKETQLMTSLVSANLEALDKRLQMEMSLKNDLIFANQKAADAALKSHEREDDVRRELAAAELKVVKEKNDLYIEKLFGRVQALEAERTKVADNEHAELMQWRQKAMGLSSPNAVVPLMTREAAAEPTKK